MIRGGMIRGGMFRGGMFRGSQEWMGSGPLVRDTTARMGRDAERYGTGT